MTTAATSGWQRVGLILALVVFVGACSGTAPAGETSPSERTPMPSLAVDVFAALPYRMSLPADWITLGSEAYDDGVDSTPEVQAWLAGLGLDGQNAFRAYEPLDGATGLRIAVNPQRTWNPSPLQDEGSVAALPGVTGKVSSDVLATGDAWKAFGYRWSESMDWGSGTPSARDCIGYFVMVDPNPVNVVFCWPPGTDRSEDAQAIVATFVMTGTPIFSLAPGETPTPSPTPFDKLATPAPSVAVHAAPDLEALLPDVLAGSKVQKESQTGLGAGMTNDNPILAALGKQPADIATAQGLVRPGETRSGAIVGVQRVAGIPGDRLLAAILETMPDAKLSQVTLGGRQVTLVEYGAWPVWMYATGDLVYSAGLADEAMATEFFAAVP